MVPLNLAVQVTLIWGISGYEHVDRKPRPIYRDNFNFDTNITQQELLDACIRAKTEPTLLIRSEVPCIMERLKTLAESEGGFPVPAERRASDLARLLGPAGANTDGNIGVFGPSLAGPVRYVRQPFRVNLLGTAGADKLTPVYEQWQKFLDSMNEAVQARGLGGNGLEVIMVSKEFNRMHVERTILLSTVHGFVVAVGVVLLSVVVFTGNVVVAAYAVTSVLLSIFALFGILISALKWEFGPVQAIGLITFMGLSVDYTLHLTHAYHQAEQETRRERIRHALSAIGPAILGGGLTTAGATIFTMPCWIFLFFQLGVMLCMNTILGLTSTFFFLAPLLAVCGPTGDTGQIFATLSCRPCRRRWGSHATTRAEAAKPQVPACSGVTEAAFSEPEQPRTAEQQQAPLPQSRLPRERAELSSRSPSPARSSQRSPSPAQSSQKLPSSAPRSSPRSTLPGRSPRDSPSETVRAMVI